MQCNWAYKIPFPPPPQPDGAGMTGWRGEECLYVDL